MPSSTSKPLPTMTTKTKRENWTNVYAIVLMRWRESECATIRPDATKTINGRLVKITTTTSTTASHVENTRWQREKKRKRKKRFGAKQEPISQLSLCLSDTHLLTNFQHLRHFRLICCNCSFSRLAHCSHATPKKHRAAVVAVKEREMLITIEKVACTCAARRNKSESAHHMIVSSLLFFLSFASDSEPKTTQCRNRWHLHSKMRKNKNRKTIRWKMKWKIKSSGPFSSVVTFSHKRR